MNKEEKQIEEIENIIDDYLQGLMSGNELTLAKKIYEKILPENAVVLTRKEFDEDYVTKEDRDYWKYKSEMYKEQIIQARKKTAREILDEIGAANSDAERYDIWCKLCEKYGVEVKE